MTKRETPKQEALRLIRDAHGEFDDIGDPGELKGCAGTGPGRIWNATGCHSCVVHFHTDRPAGWKSLLEDLRRGTSICDLEDCEICADGVTLNGARPPEPMGYHGPGWNIEAGTLFQLWAPNDKRDHWAAAWSSENGVDGDYRRGATKAEALVALDSFPHAVLVNQFRSALSLAASEEAP